ncbi:MAG: 16S rRNA (adenine(1518)-N(6)/adenine(1519)-N(6))-dimethyltransferase RsmA [Candidatus Omnitrophota bacterium]|nr:16S rRNA (adenine(1518)-N(6)/adenine(1519)-N(6))-dimethyltransferase RsmA [Candidatus Omnitrophota bacterium]
MRELKAIWKEHGFRPEKRLGQNFLIDKNVRDKIINTLPAAKDKTLVEIGAGFGVMTFALAERCGKLVAIEKDRRILEIIEPFFAGKENVRLVHNDVLQADICGFARPGERIAVFGNIPYYISTPIIEKMIDQKRCIDSVFLMMQEELVDRIVSSPGTKRYGSVSCYVQYHTVPEKLFRINKNSFYPRPRVGSCLLKLRMLQKPGIDVKDEKLMFDIIHKAFSQRRKKMINPLSDGGVRSMDRGRWTEVFSECGIDTSNRAEDLSLADYAKLADRVSAG